MNKNISSRQMLLPVMLMAVATKSQAFRAPVLFDHSIVSSWNDHSSTRNYSSLANALQPLSLPQNKQRHHHQSIQSKISNVRLLSNVNNDLDDYEMEHEMEDAAVNDVQEDIENSRNFSKLQSKRKIFLWMQDIKQQIESGNQNSPQKAQAMIKRIWQHFENTGGIDVERVTTLRQAYNLWIHALARSGWPNAGEIADRILKEMKEGIVNEETRQRIKIAPDVVTYSSVMDAHAKSNSPERAEQVLFELLDDETASSTVSSVTSDTVLNAWAQKGTQEGAERAQSILFQLERLQGKNIRPTQISYATVMNAWAKVGSGEAAEKAEALLKKMIEYQNSSNAFAGSVGVSVLPDTVIFNGAINAWAASGDARAGTKALSLLQIMKKLSDSSRKQNYPSPDIVTYNTVLSAWSRCGHVNAAVQAEKLVKEMLQDPTVPDPNTVSYNTVLDAWSKSTLPGAAPRAQKVLEYMIRASAKNRDVAPDTISFTSTLNAWAKSKEPNKAMNARKLLDKLLKMYSTERRPELKPTAIPYNVVLNACAFSAIGTSQEERKEALQIAVRTYTEMNSRKSKLPVAPDKVTYGNLIKCFANLMPHGKARTEMTVKVFERCCDEGLVGTLVWNEVRRAVPSSFLMETFNLKRSPRSMSLRDLPRSWVQQTSFDKKAPKSKTRKRKLKKDHTSEDRGKVSAPHRSFITESTYQSGLET